MSSTDLAEYFIPSAKNLAQHISSALELAEEYAERKKMQEAVVHEHSLLHFLMDNIPDWIFFKDPKWGRWLVLWAFLETSANSREGKKS